MYLQYMLHVMLYPMINLLCLYISPSRSLCAVLSVSGFRSFFFTSSFPSTLFRYFLDDFEVVPVAPSYYWYHFYFYIPHSAASIVRLLCFEIFSTYFLNQISVCWSYNAYSQTHSFFPPQLYRTSWYYQSIVYFHQQMHYIFT
jgi:hypothetical protein